jgi:hypothetical protein
MKKMRAALVILSLLSLFSLVIGMASSGSAESGTLHDSLSAVTRLLFAACTIGNAFLSYRYAGSIGRSAFGWAAAAFLLPYIAPIVLAFRPELPGGSTTVSVPGAAGAVPFSSPVAASPAEAVPPAPMKDLFTKSRPSSPEILLKEGLFGDSRWRLDRLRLFCVVVPGTFKWRVVTSSRELGMFFPDLLPDETADSLYGFLEEALESGNRDAFQGVKVCLAGFDGETGVFDLQKMKTTRGGLLGGLYHFRGERRARLKEFLDGAPVVTLKGWLGRKAILDRDGFHVGKKQLPWADVKGIQVETMNGMVTHMYVLPEGRSGGIFDLKRGKYSLTGIPTKKKELYVAECNFWRTLVA